MIKTPNILRCQTLHKVNQKIFLLVMCEYNNHSLEFIVVYECNTCTWWKIYKYQIGTQVMCSKPLKNY